MTTNGCCGQQDSDKVNGIESDEDHNETSHDDRTFKTNTSVCNQIPLKWKKRPQKVLVIKKRNDGQLTQCIAKMAHWMVEEHNLQVFVEPSAKDDLPELDAFKKEDLPLKGTAVDFIVCVGGDGALLHVNSLFKNKVPPVIAFFHGTLGFLTPFHIENFKEEINRVLNGEAFLTLRARLQCTIQRAAEYESEYEDPGNPLCDQTEFQVLNEVVLDRGPSPYMSELLCFCNDQQITSVRADGIILATPSGSTAYSLSAGASMIHPVIPGILMTPICAHSLSFRPVMFPDCVKLTLQVPPDARTTAWASLDGRCRKQLCQNDSIVVKTSCWPFLSVTRGDPIVGWFTDLANIMHWNKKLSHY